MLKLPVPLQQLIHDGQSLFLFGADTRELADAVKQLCAMHGQVPYWVMVGSKDLIGEAPAGVPLLNCHDGPEQAQLLLRAARQDPDGLLAVPLYPEGFENFFRLVMMGSCVASYAVLPFAKIEDFITKCRQLAIADDVVNQVCHDFLFVEINHGYVNTFEIEIADGLVDVWVPEELEDELPTDLAAKAAPPPWQPEPLDREVIETWLQERSSQDLTTVMKFERPAWIPQTSLLSSSEVAAIAAYQDTLGLGEMILQIATDQLPTNLRHAFPKASFVQIFCGPQTSDLNPTLKILKRADLKDLPAVSHFRGRFALQTWLEVKDYPHFQDFEKLGIPWDTDGDPVNACFPLTKFGGWPAWLQGSEQNPERDNLFCQIASMIGEFELFLGADLNAFLFVKGETDLTAVIQSS